MANHGEIVSFIWGVADLIRDSFKRGHYQDVILPFTVLRRIDCVLAPTRPKVLERYHKLKDRLDNLDPQVHPASERPAYLDPQIDLKLSWTDFAQAIEALLDRRVNGKAVLTVD